MKRVIIIPEIMFENRHIAIESFGPTDKEGEKLAVALSRIMKERIFSKTAPKSPLIRPIGIG